MLLRSLCVAAFVGGLLLQSAQAASVSLTPAKDNTLIQASNPAAQLSNGAGDIFVGRTAQDGSGPNTTATISIRRGLVDFSLVGKIPTNATITGVTLTMRDVMGLNGDPVVSLYRVLQDWGQGTSFQNGGMGATPTQNDATWLYTFYNAANPGASPTWSTPGGSFSSTVSGSEVVSDDNGPDQFFTWNSSVNPQMIADVQFWLANPDSNFGWLLQGDESQGQTAKRLNSSESAFPPTLVISYTVPEPASLGLAAVAASCLLLGRIGRRRA